MLVAAYDAVVTHIPLVPSGLLQCWCWLQADLEQQNQLLLSLEACAACLHVLSAPNMPKQVYKEELIDKILALVKYHLLHNVLVYYNAGICQANRPSLLVQGMLPACVQHSWHVC